ncbi:MAG: hypothetical protein JXR83_22415 [Deltaproteobacteria bacterium]|nr:hypothetical protein [Deltaproteobacteria bacterium]
MKLADILLIDGKRPDVIRDCSALVDHEVDAKTGIAGLAIKAGYRVVKALKPGIINEAFDSLLDDFVAKLDPHFQASQQARARSFGEYATPRAGEIAESLLGITDDRAARADNRTIKKTYEKLRPYGKKNVEQAVPGIGRLIDKHAALVKR